MIVDYVFLFLPLLNFGYEQSVSPKLFGRFPPVTSRHRAIKGKISKISK